MSLYDELCEAFKAYGEKFLAYRDDCYWLAQIIVPSIREYFQCESGQLGFTDRDGKSTHLSNALYLAEGDPSYRLNMWLSTFATVSLEAPRGGVTEYPIKSLFRFCILIKSQDERFTLKLDKFDESFPVSKSLLTEDDRQSDLNDFYFFIHQTIKNQYRTEFQQFLKGQKLAFGFQISNIS